MTEIKSPEPNTIPEVDAPKKRPSEVAVDLDQTKLPPPKVVVSESGNSSDLTAELAPAKAAMGWFKKLSQRAIIGISLAILITFLALFLLLLTQARQISKTSKPLAAEQLSEAGEISNRPAGTFPENKLAQATGTILALTDDEFAGQAPMAVKASGPVVSNAIDPELAAMVDALKIRLKMSTDSKSTSRGNITTKATRGDYRGFKITIDEKIENKNTVSEEIIVITPQKGFIKTINSVLEAIKESDLGRFTVELQNAGLEISKLPLQLENKLFRVQIKTRSIFGKPINDDLLISGKSVGKIFLGMPTTQLETILLSSYIVLKRKVLVNDIYYDVYKILDQSNEPLFFVYENKGRVWGIAIISENFKTAKGIGIGSSLGNMRINYPLVNVGISEKRTPFVKIDDVAGLFVMQSEGVDIKKQIFPNKTLFISILIGNSPEFE